MITSLRKPDLSLLEKILSPAALALGTLLALPAEAAVLATVEAETMSLPAGATIIADAQASGGQGVQFAQNGSATASFPINGTVTSFVVTAKGVRCKGDWPRLTVALNGHTLISGVSVASSTWASYSPTNNFSDSYSTQTLTITASNTDACGRYLSVDVTTLSGNPPVPTVNLSAAPKLLTPGNPSTLTWSTANATSCTASGAWSGAKATSGSESVTVNATSNYSLSCTGPGGTVTKSAKVTTDSLNSGVPMPTGAVTSGGHTWQPIFAEDFTVDSAFGSWGAPCDASQIAYTGAGNTLWQASCGPDTNTFSRPYSAQILSTQNGLLDVWLSKTNWAGTSISPVLDNATLSHYTTYGRIEARLKQTEPLYDVQQNLGLKPQSDSDAGCANSTFPQGSMSSGSVSYVARYGCQGAQDQGSASIDKTQWHTYTQEWLPGQRNYYIDGVLVGSSTNQVWSQPERWQLQIDTICTPITAPCVDDGHLLVDWVVVYAY